MPNIPSAKKHLRQTKKLTAKNNAVKNKAVQAMRATRALLKEGNLASAHENLKKAIQLLDKAVSSGILKKNTAGRKKSRLTKALNKTK